jgi:hypothetical protein
MLERRHLALIHLAKKHLCLDDDTYRDILRTVAGVGSAKDLDLAGFEKVMGRFTELGFESTRPGRPADEDPDTMDMISDRQQAYIRFLFHQVGIDELRRQVGFCERQLAGKRWPQSRDDARVVIESLKKMAARGYRAKKRDEKIPGR